MLPSRMFTPNSMGIKTRTGKETDTSYKKFSLSPVLLSTTLPLYLGLNIRPTAVEPIFLIDLTPR